MLPAAPSLAIGAARSSVTPHRSSAGIRYPATICYADSTKGERRMQATHF
jgi:hypothetical protein